MGYRLRGLRPRLLVVVFLAVLPALAAIFTVTWRERRAAVAEVGRVAERLAALVVREHARSLADAKVFASTFAGMLAERGVVDAPRCAAAGVAALRLEPRYSNLGTIDEAGNLTCSVVPIGASFSVGGSPCFEKARTSRAPSACGYHLGAITGKPTVSVVVPAPELGPLGGFTFASIDASWFHAPGGELLPEEGALTVVDTEGNVIARHPGPERWLGRRLPEGPLFERIMNRTETTAVLSGVDGVTRVYAVKALRGDGPPALGYLALGVSPRDRLDQADEAMRGHLLLLGGVLVLALAAAWVGGEVLVLRPMQPLVDATRRIGLGDLSARTGPRYVEGEVGELARAFDEMASALQEREAERSRVGAALRKSEERYELVSRATNDAVWDWNPATDELWWGKGYERLFGESPVTTLAEWEERIHPDDRARVTAGLTRVVDGEGSHWSDEYRFRKADGSFAAVLDRGYVLHDASGKTIRMIGAMLDITSRKRADEERERLAAILESTSDIVAMADAAGRLLYLNAAARSVLGVGAEEDVSRLGLLDFHPADARDVIALEAFAGARERGAWRGETVWRARDGREIPTSEVVLAHRDAGGDVELFSTIARDITDIKRAESALLRSYEALRALSGRLESVREEEGTRIAREIHDELGQALTAFKMDVAWIKRKCADPAATAGLAALLEPRLLGMLKLIDGTIDIVHRISTELRPGVLDDLGLSPAVEWSAGEFEKRFGIECSVSTATVTPSRAVATAAFRILQEILTNVARHAAATEVTIRLEEQAGELLLTVKDNGKGIDGDALSDSKSFGLIGMRERAALVGGTVRLSGGPGKGTLVTVRLPLRPETEWDGDDGDASDDELDEAI